MIKIRPIFKYLFNDKIHISWLVSAGCLGVILGVGISLIPDTAIFASSIFFMLSILLFVFSAISRLRIMVVIALMAGILMGMWRGTLTRVDLSDYSNWMNQEVVIRGKVNSDPDFVSGREVRLRLTNIEIILSDEYKELDNKVDDVEQYFTSLAGQIWVSSLSSEATNIKRSDTVEVSGKLKVGFGAFSASMVFADLRQVVHSPDNDPMRDLRDGFGQALRRVIDEPAADLGMGILAGQKTTLPSDLADAFIIASLTHIVVASGYNLTILIRFARRLFARISRFAALSLGGIMVAAFASVTGFSPSMTRASLVAGLSLLAWYYGRRFHPLALILLVASITLMMDPSQLWGDPGWYLSFASFIGVIMLAPLIKAYFWGGSKKMTVPWRSKLWAKFRRRYFAKLNFVAPMPREPSFNLRQIFIETTSAQIMAAPIIALFMGQFSPYGILANLLVLPMLPLTMFLTFVAGIGALVLPQAIAEILAVPAGWLLNWVINVANYVSELPDASEQIQLSLSANILIFAVIIGVIFYLKHRTHHNFREDNVVE